MADFSSLKQTIRTYVKQNGNEEITGNILQDVLLAMVSTMGDGAINSLASALQDETTQRQNQDVILQGNISTLGGRIDTLQAAINGINTKLAEGYIYAGIATPSTNPGTPSGKVFYIAVQEGTYTNFGGTVVTEGITILKYNGTSWVKEQALFTDGGVFDVSAYNNDTYDDLADALSGNNIPLNIRKGGMSVKFVQSSDNKYVRFNYLLEDVTDATFTNVSNWQKSDIIRISNQSFSDFMISDENGNCIVMFKDGYIRTKNFNSEEVNKNTNQSFSDFTISDENGNCIVMFKDGHIRTKNFNSANIPQNLLLKGKTYSILGDSISTYQGYLPSDEAGYDGATYAYFYPRTGLDNVNQTWWKKMEEKTGLSLLRNCSWSGSECCGDSTSTTDAVAGCSTRRVSDLSKNGINPDIIIIYIGINDMNLYTLGTWTADEEIPAEGTVIQYAKAYALCLAKVMRAYPSAEIYCCSLLECPTVDIQTGTKTFPCINSHGETLRQYNKAIEEICVGIGANFVDLHACGINYWNCYPTYFLDTTHPNDNGTTLMADYISSKILSTTKLKY